MHAIQSKITSWILCFSLFICVTAHALERPLPADAKLAKLNLSANRVIMIDGTERQLTAGAQIRNQQNQIIQPQSLTDSSAPILYKENNQGQITRIWMLTEEEADNYSPKKLNKLVRPSS